MEFNLEMSARLDADDIRAAVAEVCRRRLAEQFPGAVIDGEITVTCAYGYLPDVKVSYGSKKKRPPEEKAETESFDIPVLEPITARPVGLTAPEFTSAEEPF